MAVIVTLPIPFGNWLPAFSSVLLGLALIERDGLLFAIASIVGIAAIALVVSVIGAVGMLRKRRLRVAAVGGAPRLWRPTDRRPSFRGDRNR